MEIMKKNFDRINRASFFEKAPVIGFLLITHSRYDPFVNLIGSPQLQTIYNRFNPASLPSRRKILNMRSSALFCHSFGAPVSLGGRSKQQAWRGWLTEEITRWAKSAGRSNKRRFGTGRAGYHRLVGHESHLFRLGSEFTNVTSIPPYGPSDLNINCISRTYGPDTRSLGWMC